MSQVEVKDDSSNTTDTVPKVEYKEYNFETSSNKDAERKVASFWKHFSDLKPPKPDFFKTPEIYECLEEIEDEYSLEEEEKSSRVMNQKWTNTFCLFKKRGLKQTALSAMVKKCPLCHNEKFAPIWADEHCLDLVCDK